MSNRAFDRIVAGLNDAVAIVNGTADPATYRVYAPREVDVAAIRKRLRLTQAQFAAKFGFPVGTVRDWEQGRSKPEHSARVLLTVIDRSPEAVLEALSA